MNPRVQDGSPFVGVDNPGNPTQEHHRLKQLKEECLLRPPVNQPMHTFHGWQREHAGRSGYLPMISNHLLKMRETYELTERHEGFTGQTCIYTRASYENRTVDFRGCCAGVEPWDGKLREMQEKRIQQLKENHLRSKKRKAHIWVEQLYPQKWRCLHDLHTLAAESKKQRQPTPVDRAFINGKQLKRLLSVKGSQVADIMF